MIREPRYNLQCVRLLSAIAVHVRLRTQHIKRSSIPSCICDKSKRLLLDYLRAMGFQLSSRTQVGMHACVNSDHSQECNERAEKHGAREFSLACGIAIFKATDAPRSQHLDLRVLDVFCHGDFLQERTKTGNGHHFTWLISPCCHIDATGRKCMSFCMGRLHKMLVQEVVLVFSGKLFLSCHWPAGEWRTPRCMKVRIYLHGE